MRPPVKSFSLNTISFTQVVFKSELDSLDYIKVVMFEEGMIVIELAYFHP